jgi:hypothetical protein
MPLKLSERISMLPVIHGSGDFANAVRQYLLSHACDCLAVPLPPSYEEDVLAAIQFLPMPSIVSQRTTSYRTEWTPSQESEEQESLETANYVPIDPCQPVIAALRMAMGEHIPCEFIDLDSLEFRTENSSLPDPYALKNVSLDQFAAAVLPAIRRPKDELTIARIRRMAKRLRELEEQHQSIVFVCSVHEWPWIREAYTEQLPDTAFDEDVRSTETHVLSPETLMFMLGELPFITSLYERARNKLEDDANLSVDGVKELLISARREYDREMGSRGRKITPHLLSTSLKYIRNLTLFDRRLTPDLYNIVIGAKQVAGDNFALHVAELAARYQYDRDTPFEEAQMSIDKLRYPDGEMVSPVSRLPGPPLMWRSCKLRPRPDDSTRDQWQMRWNPFAQCSWPPEDQQIEDFRTHVADRAKAIMGSDLAKTEKFSTSLKDGLDIRDTLRNWHTGDLYVKVLPPSRGHLDAVVMLFDSPVDPREYTWRTTWFAEHQNESTLAFFASDFRQEMVGPGIGIGTYGGALFLFPPVAISDIWTDRRLDFTETLEERVLAAACMYSQCSHIALLSPLPPGAGWRRLAKRFKKKWVHVPLGSFGASTVERLRTVHVLNGHEVRSYADEFIRKW